jgi:hypothetical protein
MFITGGADALLDPGPRAPRAAELGVPLEPELAVRVNGATMLVAGVALAVSVWPRLAARYDLKLWMALLHESATYPPA